MAMTKVSEVTVGSGGATAIEFTSIPQTGKDLLLLTSMRDDFSGTNGFPEVLVNATDEDGSGIFLRGSGSAATSGTILALQIESCGSTATSNTFSNNSVYISNYTSASNKSVSIDTVTENNATAARQQLIAGVLDVTDAITSLKVNNGAANFVQYSTASLYIIS
jgi:hypothetical protein